VSQAAEACRVKRFALSAGICILIAMALASVPAAAGVRNAHINRLASKHTGCAGADDPTAGVAVQEAAMACLVNNARADAGVAKLPDVRKLDVSADHKAADILRCNQFSHEACGRDFLYWFRHAGYTNARCWWAGENLAWGTGSLGSARSIFKAWMHSPPHRANLLGKEFHQMGLSLRIGGLSGRPGAHVWVNHFGSHC
jgi:uncharacterized protein YkwD